MIGNVGIDTNGAGDSLAVGFLVSRVLEGSSLEESIRRGQITALLLHAKSLH
jgi:sugar/nucleoside kinase (ribokinase family)